MPRTKIVCTIGPASREPEILSRLVREGMDVARLNFAHGDAARSELGTTDLMRVYAVGKEEEEDVRSCLNKHLQAGAKYAILSAPSKGKEMPTVVHGVNAPGDESTRMISCASCTTNCITPVVEVMDRRIGIEKAIMTTIHAYTSSQSIVDAPSRKIRRGRAGAANFVPTSTGAAIATTLVIPSLEGQFDGVAVRGPVPVGSIGDIVFLTSRETTIQEVNDIFREEAQTTKYKGILGVTKDPIVSSDIIGNSHASLVDLGMTLVVDGNLVKVMSWYDNEWGFTSQMIREGVRIAEAQGR